MCSWSSNPAHWGQVAKLMVKILSNFAFSMYSPRAHDNPEEVGHDWTLLIKMAEVNTNFFVSQQTSSLDFYWGGAPVFKSRFKAGASRRKSSKSFLSCNIQDQLVKFNHVWSPLRTISSSVQSFILDTEQHFIPMFSSTKLPKGIPHHGTYQHLQGEPHSQAHIHDCLGMKLFQEVGHPSRK